MTDSSGTHLADFWRKLTESTYLDWQHFSVMMVLAAFIHIFGMVALDLIPRDEVVQIPIRVLNIKLGNSDDPALAKSSETTGSEDTKHLLDGKHADEDEGVAVVTALPAIDMQESENDYEDVLKSFESAINLKKEIQSTGDKSLEEMLTAPAVKKVEKPKNKRSKSLPKQYVRETNKPHSVGQGSVLGDSTSIDAEILARYEQLISKWIQRHKEYPAEAKRAGIGGEAVVRIRIDRNGEILLSRLERPTGHRMLDDAVLEMIRRANPIPRVPENYPAGNLFEFLIPVSFKLR